MDRGSVPPQPNLNRSKRTEIVNGKLFYLTTARLSSVSIFIQPGRNYREKFRIPAHETAQWHWYRTIYKCRAHTAMVVNANVMNAPTNNKIICFQAHSCNVNVAVAVVWHMGCATRRIEPMQQQHVPNQLFRTIISFQLRYEYYVNKIAH